MHKSSYKKTEAFRRRHLADRERDQLRILDVGSQDVNGCYRPIFDAPAWTYRGLNMSLVANVDIVIPGPYDWRSLPSGSFDAIVTGQALEHVEYFWVTMLEMARAPAPAVSCVPSHHRVASSTATRLTAGGTTPTALESWRDGPCSTCWNALRSGSPPTADGSEAWKDTLLVARRRERGPWNARFATRSARRSCFPSCAELPG